MVNAASLVLLALVAQAASPPASPDAKAKAQTLLKEGAKYYENGALVQAFEKFTEAYAQFQSPKLLFNIGQASRDLGRFAEAMSAFERFLDEAPDAPADMTTEAKKSVSELQGKLGKLRIQCAKAGAEISVDGKLVGVAPLTEPIWAAVGSHQVTARHPATAPAVEDVEVNAGWVHTVVMSLQPVVDVTVAPEPAPVRRPSLKAAGDRRDSAVVAEREGRLAETKGQGHTWTWVAGGAALVFTGAAIGLGTSMQSKYDSLIQSCGSASAGYSGCKQGDIDAVILRRNLANVSWGLAAAAAATAGVLFFVEGRTVSVAPMAGEATGLTARMLY
jgi:hypothetical protein